MAQAIVSIFKNQESVEAAIQELRDLNYNPADFSVVMKDVRQTEEISNNLGTNVAEGAVSGAVTGGILAGLTGLLVGLGIIAFPGLGALFVAGPLATTLGLTGAAATATTAAVTGAVGGGLIGALASFGFPENEAEQYEEFIRAGGILLVVPTRDQRTQEVRDIIVKHGATDIKQLDLLSVRE